MKTVNKDRIISSAFCRDCVPSAIVSIAAIEIQEVASVALHTVFKVCIELGTDFGGRKFTIQEVGYPEELVILRPPDIRGF